MAKNYKDGKVYKGNLAEKGDPPLYCWVKWNPVHKRKNGSFGAWQIMKPTSGFERHVGKHLEYEGDLLWE